MKTPAKVRGGVQQNESTGSGCTHAGLGTVVADAALSPRKPEARVWRGVEGEPTVEPHSEGQLLVRCDLRADGDGVRRSAAAAHVEASVFDKTGSASARKCSVSLPNLKVSTTVTATASAPTMQLQCWVTLTALADVVRTAPPPLAVQLRAEARLELALRSVAAPYQ